MNKSILLMAAAFVAAPLAFAHNPAGTPKNYCEDPSEWYEHDYGPLSGGQFSFVYYDGNLGDCDGDGTLYDADGHFEYAGGGAFFPVDTGDGVNGGSLACFGTVGHHPAFGPFRIEDLVFGPTASYTVAADTYDATGLNPLCGDGFMDSVATCVFTCFVTFGPGLDGAYYVYIDGTAGHAYLG